VEVGPLEEPELVGEALRVEQEQGEEALDVRSDSELRQERETEVVRQQRWD
jgi:hypothetical protein